MKRGSLASAFLLLKSATSAVAANVCSTVTDKQLLSERQISLLEKSAQKSQYETSSAYEQRIRKLIPNLVAASIDVYDNPIATPFRYDADEQKLIVAKDSLPDRESANSKDGRLETATISIAYKQGGSYIGENALGAVRRVEQLHTLYFDFSWSSDGPTFSPPDDIPLSLNPHDARMLRTRLKLLLVGEPLPPLLTVGEGTHTSPTMSSGVDATTDTVMLPLRPICASVYDGKTKRVFASWSAAEVKQ